MHGLDEHVPLGVGPHEGVAHRGQPVQVERFGALGRGHRGGVTVGLPPRHPHAHAVHGDDAAVADGAERRRQVGVPGQEPVRGAPQPGRVERARQLHQLLHHVRVAPARGGVEVEARGQRGEREHVAQLGGVQRGHVGGGERDEVEVGRGVPRYAGIDGDVGEQRGPPVGEGDDLRFGEHAVRPAELGHQHRPRGGLLGHGVDLQHAGQRHPGVAGLRHRACDPPEVVQQHLRGHGQARAATEVAQRAVAQPVRRHRPQLVLHGLDGGAEVGALAGVDHHRIERGEPAERPGEVEVAAHRVRFPAVALQLQQHRPVAAADGERSGRDEQVVDTAVDGGGHRPEQPRGDVGGEAHGVAALAGDDVARRVERARAQRGLGDARHPSPVRLVRREPAARRGGDERAGPLPVGRGGPLQRRGAAEGGPQVFPQHAQGHPVDHDVVDRDHQPTGRPAEGDHGSRRRVQPVRRTVRDDHRGDAGRIDHQAAAHDPRPQHVVGVEQGGQRPLEPFAGQLDRDRHLDGLVEAGEGRTVLAQPRDDRGVRHRTDDHLPDDHLVGRRRHHRRGHPGQLAGCAVGEHVAGTHVQPGGPRLPHHADGDDAVAAEGEEVVVREDLGQVQDRREHRAQHPLGLGGGCPARLARRRGWGQRRAVELAVLRCRERVEHGDDRGHRGLGQPVGAVADVVQLGLLGDDVAREVGDARPGGRRGDGGLPHGRVRGQHRGHLVELQPHPADLHLLVGAADELQGALGRPAGEVAGAVQPGPAVPAERVGHEAGRGERRGVHVAAAEQEACRVQLAGHARPHRPQPFVEHVQLGVRVGSADRGDDAFGPVAVDHVRDADGGLGGPVAVVERGGELVAEPGEQLRGEHLAAAPHVAQPGQPPQPGVHAQQHVQHGRDEVHECDALVGDEVEQVLRVALAARLGHDDVAPGHERQQDLVDRDVEGERRLEQRRVPGPEPQHLLDLPAQPLADGLVADHRALGATGGAGGEDDVGEPVGRDGQVERFGGLGGVGVLGEVGRAQREHGAGVGQHLAAPQVGPRRVDGHERATRDEHGQHPDHHLRGARHCDADHVLGREPALAQRPGQPEHPGAELAVGQAHAAGCHQRERGRRAADLAREQLGDGAARLRLPRVVPVGQPLGQVRVQAHRSPSLRSLGASRGRCVDDSLAVPAHPAGSARSAGCRPPDSLIAPLPRPARATARPPTAARSGRPRRPARHARPARRSGRAPAPPRGPPPRPG